MTRYTYEEAFTKSKEYFYGNELSAKVFLDKYALRDLEGHILESTPDEMHDRLASEFARIDAEKYGLDYQIRYQIYRSAINKFARIVPQGSPMSAVGNTHQRMSASNCVVIESPRDSIGGIIEAGCELAELYKRRCGVGLDISTLRPDGALVSNAARTTSGAWSFANFFSDITRMIGQAGRRGALMITLSVHHPDILKFVTMKQDLTKVTGANISVRLSDEFLRAVENDTEYEVRWPVDSKNPKVAFKLKAKEVWDVIIESATKTAEPGLIMWDNMINNLPAHCYEEFKTISTNPCSEIALSAYDSCRLISINLTGYVHNAFQHNAQFDFEAFASDIRLGQQMADNLIDLELELITKIKEVCEPGRETDLWNKLYQAGFKGRRTGLGTHGLADALAQLNIRYDSEDGIILVDRIYQTLRDTAYDASIELAKTRGPFPIYSYEKETKCDFINRLPPHLLAKMEQHGRRNIALLTQAPTGSVSILSKVGEFNRFNVSSGVEPVFRNSYIRRKKINPGDKNSRVDYVDIVGDSWQEFTVYHSNADNYLALFGVSELPNYFVTSDQIDWEKRVVIQGVEQQYIDHSISSTINLPKGTQPDVVAKLYLKSWKKGLKGVTVYVDGCRDGVLITNKASNAEVDQDGRPVKILTAMAPKRPAELPCEIHHATVKGVKWTVMVGLLHGEPYELFMGRAADLSVPVKHKTGKLVKAGKGIYNLHATDEFIVKNIIKTSDDDESAWATRMISTSLRHGIPVEYLVEQLSKDGSVVDINNVLARILRKYAKSSGKKKDACPQCGGEDLIYEEKCKRCASTECGWSGCN